MTSLSPSKGGEQGLHLAFCLNSPPLEGLGEVLTLLFEIRLLLPSAYFYPILYPLGVIILPLATYVCEFPIMSVVVMSMW